MRADNDTVTADLLGDTCDLAGPIPQKPAPLTAAERAARFRDKNGVRGLTLNIDKEILVAFEAYCIARSKKKGDVIAKLIETQLLRKR